MINRFYRFCHAFFYPIFRVLFPFCVHGLENVPLDRPVVLCGNHAHAMDPFLICLALPRTLPVRIMAKKELMEAPLLGAFLHRLGAFGVDRGNSDLYAVKTAMQTIRSGSNLLIFPEGTRVKHEGETDVKGGVAMIAMRTGAALLPVYAGTPRKFLHKTHIVFGEPYEPKSENRRPTAEEYHTYANEIMHRAYALGKEWSEGV